ncbi:hypothetical protein JAAARDRAFT_665956 [Jaapia argillacea MUCL 33604]|uniref:CHAT domain-containing protein n=1 Tax=Jaapia argillacea MUCL 33604 TaxID=933084 RepID=A0A067PWY8_9AGAM|nr:hypothetical protein JAAARDRAFT_665956 [Jaapia argillacea MUCL 33604]
MAHTPPDNSINHSCSPACIDAKIEKHRSALDKHPTANRKRARVLMALGAALNERFSELHQQADIDEAVESYRQSLTMVESDDRLRPRLLTGYGSALHNRFHSSHKLSDIDESILHHRQALELLHDGHTDQRQVLRGFLDALSCERRPVLDAPKLDEAVALSRRAVELSPPLEGCHLFLCHFLLQQFESSGKQREFDEVVQLLQDLENSDLDDSDKAITFCTIAFTLFHLFQKTDNLLLLDEAISLLRRARNLPHRPPEASASDANLAACLISRYEWLYEHQDVEAAENLEEAEIVCREALLQNPSAGRARQFALEQMADTFHHQFKRLGWSLGNAGKLNEAIAVLYEHLNSMHGDRHRASSLRDLANALHFRYKASPRNDSRDLDAAISLLRKALLLLPPRSRGRLDAAHDLASVLSSLFHHSGNSAFLDDAIQLQTGVLSDTPDQHPLRQRFTQGLGNIMLQKYYHSRQRQDLDECISLHTQALSLAGFPHGKASIYTNLIPALQASYYLTDSIKDLDLAISTCREALLEAPPSRGYHPSLSGYLGGLLTARFRLTKQPHDLHEAMSAFAVSVACEFTPVPQRFFCAQQWAKNADINGHESALEAYETAIGFLPRIAMLGLDISSRQHVLTSGIDGLARDGAAFAIREGKFEKAVEFLEEGRAVFWSQALQLRAPLDDLRSQAPELADQLEEISKQLERESLPDVRTTQDLSPEVTITAEKQSNDRLRLNDRWLACLEKVRSIKRFEKFLLPKKYPDLLFAAARGPVVILNASESRFDALILKGPETDILHVPLTHLTGDMKEELVGIRSLLTDAVPWTRGEDRNMRRKIRNYDPEVTMRRCLAMLWELVVEPVVRVLDLKKSASPPRVWWCPTGLFSSLPLHAAGIYNSHGVGEGISDYVISSYIPTLSTLLGRAPPKVDSFKMLVVVQPKSEGYQPLPNTTAELERIERVVDNHALVRYGIPEAPARVSDVLAEIPTASIVHFACHGRQDAHSTDPFLVKTRSQGPLNSALMLEDGPLKVTQIMELALKHESLVFLSACQTAVGDQSLPDESIHLAATMLFAGFRGAVGTLWSISDEDGPEVADTFYSQLFSSEQPTGASQLIPDTAEAARALHVAVGKLRAEGRSFTRWVPFIHLGY